MWSLPTKRKTQACKQADGQLFAALVRRLFPSVDRYREIAEAARHEVQALREAARTDQLTGLLNRNGFEAALRQLVRELPAGSKLVLLWLDLRGFRQVNSNLGHAVGDEVLRSTARRIAQAASGGSVIGRFASDKFLLAAPLATRGDAERLGETIARTCAEPLRIEGHRIAGGAWLGAALLPDDGSTAEALLPAADLALHHARSTGRTALRFFTPAMTREAARKKEIEADLRTALQRDELSIYFQPIIDLTSGRIRAFEALARWFHPDKGELLPQEFIPVAEEFGLIVTLGNWITAKAARIAASWPADVALTVNFSPVQVLAPDAAQAILAALNEAGIDPSRLELEVTETLLTADDPRIASFMQELARHGIGFSLDDFGTGYSSLRHIHLYPFRTLKVDRSLVSGAQSGPRGDAVIRTLAEMGQTLGMQVVAEGLETIEQVRSASAAGCTLGQGWHFSRAVPDHAAALLLAEEAKRLGDTEFQNQRRLAG